MRDGGKHGTTIEDRPSEFVARQKANLAHDHLRSDNPHFWFGLDL
jgi:hypothetical protein